MLPGSGLFESDPSHKAFVGTEESARAGCQAEAAARSSEFANDSRNESMRTRIERTLSALFYTY